MKKETEKTPFVSVVRWGVSGFGYGGVEGENMG
jgi:hypothetical protein